MKNQLITYFLFATLSLFSQVSTAKLTPAEQTIVENSKQVAQLKSYFKNKIQTSLFEKQHFKIIKSGQYFLNKETGYLQHLNKRGNDRIWLKRGNTIVLDTAGNILSLSWRHGGLDDLSLFKSFTKMKTLNLRDNIFKNTTLNVSGLPFLKEFRLSYGMREPNLTSLTFAKDNYKLRVLEITNMPLTKINVGNLKRLTRIDFDSNRKLTTVVGLSKLKHLRWLDIDSTAIKTLPSMKRFPKLEWLNAMDSKITTVKDLSHAKRLKYINLHRTAAGQNTEPFPSRIEEIQVGGTVLTKMPNFRNLKHLRKLSIIGALQVTKIENLEGLSQLKKLDLRFSAIKKIEGLDDLKELEELNLKKNPVTKIEGVDKLVKLKVLNLQRTPIIKIEGLSAQKNLIKLYLDETKVKKIENIHHLTNLEFLNLTSSKVEEYDLNEITNLKAKISLYDTPYYKKIEKESPTLYKKLKRARKI